MAKSQHLTCGSRPPATAPRSPNLVYGLVAAALVAAGSLLLALSTPPLSLWAAAVVGALRSAVDGRAPPGHLSSRCSAASLARALPDGAEIVSAEMLPEHSSYGEGSANLGYPAVAVDLPELCAVVVRVRSSETSAYRFGLLLPTAWNERMLTVGNGGYAGGIHWTDAAVGARYGFASASTDTGHNSSAIDGAWALRQPERVADWGWRAIHGTAVAARVLAAAYYGRPAMYAYYSGCSTGGRQGLRETQLFPDTFDGALIGAPAWWTAHLQPWTTWVGTRNLPSDSPGHIGPAQFALVEAAVQKQCDAADGVIDGIISAPERCALDLDVLACAGDGTSSSGDLCLTPPQIDTVRAVYDPYVVDGKLAMPGLEKGTEWSWPVLLGGDAPNPLGTDYERYFLLDKPDWTWQDYDDGIVALADRVDPGRASAIGFSDMAAYRDRGGKILMFHGISDAYIPTRSSHLFYEKVGNATGKDSLHDWFRYFTVPGLGHCGGTNVDAPWYFAGANQAPLLQPPTLYSVPGYADADHDALLALMAWVENGTAVDSLVATTWNHPHVPASGVLRQRPLCFYPQESKWDGVGDVNQASSWRCVSPEAARP